MRKLDSCPTPGTIRPRGVEFSERCKPDFALPRPIRIGWKMPSRAARARYSWTLLPRRRRPNRVRWSCHPTSQSDPTDSPGPFMGRAILMEPHAGHRFAWPLLAMRPTARGTGHLARRVEPVLRPRIRARPTMLDLPALVEMFHGPAG